jgi:hypothetical protein
MATSSAPQIFPRIVVEEVFDDNHSLPAMVVVSNCNHMGLCRWTGRTMV